MAYLDENGLEHFWDKIKDRISSAVAPKADDADVLHKTGTETVSGEKVFSGSQTTPSGNSSALLVVKDSNLVKGETPATNHYLSLGFIDSTGDSYAQDVSSRLAVMEYKSPSEADPEGYMQIVDRGFNGGGFAGLLVGHDKDNIQYATAPATSDERTNSTDIVTRGYMEASEWNWQKSKKTGVVTFKPVPESDLEPVVDFMFIETPPAEGEKSPGNPSTITGVTQVKVTRCGKNILDATKFHASFSDRGVSWVNNGDGSVSVTRTSIGTQIAFYDIFGSISSQIYFPAGTYTLSRGGEVSNVRLAFTSYSTVIAALQNNELYKTFTLDTGVYARVYAYVLQNDAVSNAVIRPQLELGSSSTSIEIGESSYYTISLGDTYYGGSLDVATGVMTVKYRMIELSSSNLYSGTPVEKTSGIWEKPCLNLKWSQFGLCEAFGYQESAGYNGSSYFCNMYDWDRTGTTVSYHFSRSTFFLSVSASSAEEADTYITNLVVEKYAAGTPIICGYPLEIPYTVQLTPTQIRSLPALDKYEPRINTVYSDQEAVQVGYQRFYDENRLAVIEARLDALEGN